MYFLFPDEDDDAIQKRLWMSSRKSGNVCKMSEVEFFFSKKKLTKKKINESCKGDRVTLRKGDHMWPGSCLSYGHDYSYLQLPSILVEMKKRIRNYYDFRQEKIAVFFLFCLSTRFKLPHTHAPNFYQSFQFFLPDGQNFKRKNNSFVRLPLAQLY